MNAFFVMLLTWLFFAAFAFSYVEKRATIPSVSEIHQELSHRLSDGTEIYFPSDSEYANYTTRWNEAVATYPTVVVVPATKKDVTITVCTSISYVSQCSDSHLGHVRECHRRTVLCRQSSPRFYNHSARLQTRHSDQHASFD